MNVLLVLLDSRERKCCFISSCYSCLAINLPVDDTQRSKTRNSGLQRTVQCVFPIVQLLFPSAYCLIRCSIHLQRNHALSHQEIISPQTFPWYAPREEPSTSSPPSTISPFPPSDKLDHHSNHDPNSPKTVDQYLSSSAVSYSKIK